MRIRTVLIEVCKFPCGLHLWHWGLYTFSVPQPQQKTALAATHSIKVCPRSWQFQNTTYSAASTNCGIATAIAFAEITWALGATCSKISLITLPRFLSCLCWDHNFSNLRHIALRELTVGVLCSSNTSWSSKDMFRLSKSTVSSSSTGFLSRTRSERIARQKSENVSRGNCFRASISFRMSASHSSSANWSINAQIRAHLHNASFRMFKKPFD